MRTGRVATLTILSFMFALSAYAISISTSSLPSGTVGVAYSATLHAAGGRPPFTWSLVSGYLPTGLELSSSGVITGMPTTAAIYPFTLGVTDRRGNTANEVLSITIGSPSPLEVITTLLPSGSVGGSYSASLTASGGESPYTWSILNGSLPPGLVLSGATISGTPTTPNTYSFTAQVEDSNNSAVTASLSIAINAQSSGAGSCGETNVLCTSDSALNLGSPTSVNYSAPGTNANIAIVTQASNPSNQIWEFYPDPWGVTTGSGSINMSYPGNGAVSISANLSGLKTRQCRPIHSFSTEAISGAIRSAANH